MQGTALRLPKLRKFDARVPVSLRELGAEDAQQIGPLDGALLRAVDGRTHVRGLADAVDRSELLVQQALYRLERLGLIGFVNPMPQRMPAPPKRLESGFRSAMKTIPTDLSEDVPVNDD
jgi:hypothetical protein